MITTSYLCARDIRFQFLNGLTLNEYFEIVCWAPIYIIKCILWS